MAKTDDKLAFFILARAALGVHHLPPFYSQTAIPQAAKIFTISHVLFAQFGWRQFQTRAVAGTVELLTLAL